MSSWKRVLISLGIVVVASVAYLWLFGTHGSGKCLLINDLSVVYPVVEYDSTVDWQDIRVSVIRLTANSAGCSLLLNGQLPPCPDASSPAIFHQTG